MDPAPTHDEAPLEIGHGWCQVPDASLFAMPPIRLLGRRSAEGGGEAGGPGGRASEQQCSMRISGGIVACVRLDGNRVELGPAELWGAAPAAFHAK